MLDPGRAVKTKHVQILVSAIAERVSISNTLTNEEPRRGAVKRLEVLFKYVSVQVSKRPEWGRHITEHLRALLVRSPDPALEELLAELESYLPPLPAEADVLGFSVPLELASADGDLRLITTITSFATATDITLAELQLEAFLPADEATADVLRIRAERW